MKLIPVFLLAASCFLGFARGGKESPNAPAKPHVIWIIADDLGYADLGFTGCEDIPTPNLDRLAASGVVAPETSEESFGKWPVTVAICFDVPPQIVEKLVAP